MAGVKALNVQVNPNWAVIRGLFHATDRIADTRIGNLVGDGLTDQVMINSKAALGVVFKAATAIVKPAELVVFGRVQHAPSIDQSAAFNGVVPLALLGQKAALALL